jgi:putative transcriptional regulator
LGSIPIARSIHDDPIGSIEKRRYNPNLRLAFKIARAFGKLIEEVFIYEPESTVRRLDGSWARPNGSS